MKKVLLGITILTLLGIPSSLLLADTLTPLYMTIVEPSASHPVELNPIGDILYPERASFNIRGIAQPNSEVNLFGWSVIPGTDGSTNSIQAITDFQATNTGAGVKFSWTPRDLFNVKKIFVNNFDPEDTFINGVLKYRDPSAPTEASYEKLPYTCEDLKRNPIDGWLVPSTINCFFTKRPSIAITPDGDNGTSFLLFDQIVNPFNFSERVDLPFDKDNGGHIEIDKETINSTIFTDGNFCSPPTIKTTVGWIYKDGPYPQTTWNGYYEVDPFFQADSHTTYAGTVSCEHSNFFENTLSCIDSTTYKPLIPFYDSFGNEYADRQGAYFCAAEAKAETDLRNRCDSSTLVCNSACASTTYLEESSHYCDIVNTYLTDLSECIDNCGSTATAGCSACISMCKNDDTTKRVNSVSLFSRFFTEERNRFCSMMNTLPNFSCYDQCSLDYVSDNNCITFKSCSEHCYTDIVSEKSFVHDNVRVTQKIFPKTVSNGKEITEYIQIDNIGTSPKSRTVVSSFPYNSSDIPKVQMSSSPIGYAVQGSSGDTISCSHNNQVLSCDFNLGSGAMAQVSFALEAIRVGTGKRQLAYEGNVVETEYEVIDPSEGNVTARIFSDRMARIFVFEEDVDIEVEIINKTGVDINNQITLDIAFDSKCLDLPLKPAVPAPPPPNFICGDPLAGKMRCSIPTLPNTKTLSLPLRFKAKKNPCENTEISLTAKSRDFSEMKTQEKVSIRKNTRGIRALLNDGPVADPVAGSNIKDPDNPGVDLGDYSNIIYWFFNPLRTVAPAFDPLSPLFYVSPSPPSDPDPEAWENHMIVPGTYRPNVTVEGYFGHYLFSYSNYQSCNDAGGSAAGFMPIKEKFILVDGFNQYEIYGVPDTSYEQNKGVTRENGTLLAVLRDPSATHIEIPNSAFGGQPNDWHVAIFEVRESSNLQLSPQVTKDIVAKKIGSVPAVSGHLVSTAHEIEFDSAGAPTPIPSPQKMQWEFFEEIGGYTFHSLKANADGEVKIKNIPRDRINRYAGAHFLSGVYYSSDTEFSVTQKTGSAEAGRSAANFFPGHFSGKPIAYTPTHENVYGTVFDPWTLSIVSEAMVKLIGEREMIISGNTESTYAVTTSNSDGFFAFLFGTGEYILRVDLIGGRTDTFSMENTSPCPTPSPFTDTFCAGSTEFKVTKGSSSLHNLPILPNVRGKINPGEFYHVSLGDSAGHFVNDTRSNADGKFSFFVPGGNYKILSISDASGKQVSFSGGDSVNSPIANGSELSITIP